MKAPEWIMEVIPLVVQGVNASYMEAFQAVVDNAEGLEDFDSGVIQVAYAVKPESLTPTDLFRRTPYASLEGFKNNLSASAERGWMEAAGEGQYAISEKGAQLVGKMLDALNEGSSTLEVPAGLDLDRIHDLLQKVVDKAYALPEPAEKWTLDMGKYFQKALVVEGAPDLVWVRRRLIDIFAFRDDAHIAAWKPLEENGQVWETFSAVWRAEEGTSAAEIAETFASFRNYDEASYAAALSELAGRGWIAEQEGKYTATEKGKKLRQGAEDATDAFFAAPWEALTKDETKELKGLLETLAEAIKPPETEEETEEE